MTSPRKRVGPSSSGRKAVLICPTCAYESTVTDNWLEITADDVRALVCPACGEVVDHRATTAPRPPAEAD